MEGGGANSNATGWAWGVSLGLHIIALFIFGAITLTGASAEVASGTPVATVSQIKAMSEAEPIMPKPKVKDIIANKLLAQEKKAQSWNLPQEQRESVGQADDEQRNLTTLAARTVVTSSALPRSTAKTGRNGFFGSYTSERKVCFVVDCSGSMKGSFYEVLRQLKSSIDSLEPDHYFYIIFFGGDRIIEYGNGRMIRATPAAKAAAFEFMRKIRPAGRTDAFGALQRAMQIKDSAGNRPAVIYFLTDGFELSGNDGMSFCRQVNKLRKALTSQTTINTIGVWAEPTDRAMLARIAKDSGGECVLIGGQN